MTKRLEVLSYGEAIVDFLPDAAGKKVREVEWFRKESGGAPANVAVGLARLGRRVGLMCKVGDDEFGHFLREHLEQAGVDVEAVAFTDEARTGVTFISLDADGERSFMFFRSKSAEMTFRAEDVCASTIERSEIMLVGTNLLIGEELKAATWRALEVARKTDTLLVVDPNVRRHLWGSDEVCRAEVKALLEVADLVKVNDEELAFLAGEGATGRAFYDDFCVPRGIPFLIHTQGEGGASVFGPDGFHTTVPAPRVTVSDTTGAGDGFVSGLIAGICRAHEQAAERGGEALRQSIAGWGASEWRRVLSLGCYVGSRVCTELGATRALPLEESVPWTGLGF